MFDFNILRPDILDDFVGQKQLIENILIYIKSAKLRDTSLDHTLLVGNPGYGKTTLAYLISKELNQKIIIVNANAIDKPKDLIIALSKLGVGDVLFIDEIHALNRYCEEVLYSAMEDFYINLNVKNDQKREIVKFELPPFTLIGATTHVELLSKPLLDRFSISLYFSKYTDEEIFSILEKITLKIKVKYEKEALMEVAKVSRSTPRIAINYLKRINDFTLIDNKRKIGVSYIKDVLKKIGVNECGLTNNDINYLKMLYIDFEQKPIGINTISSYLNRNNKEIEEVIEKYLIEIAFIKKTSKGRVITEKGITYLNTYYK